MGGWGSGRSKYSERVTVEECYRISISSLLQGGWLSIEEGSTVYVGRPVPLHITMWKGQLSVQIICTGQQVDLLASSVHFGGLRYWFQCPCCERRCAILLMPPARQGFACRMCHDLIYSSSKDWRLAEPFLVEFAKDGINRKQAKRMLRIYRNRNNPKWLRARDR